MFNGPFQDKNTFLHNESLSVTNINLLDIYIYIYIMTFDYLVGKIQIFFFFFLILTFEFYISIYCLKIKLNFKGPWSFELLKIPSIIHTEYTI